MNYCLYILGVKGGKFQFSSKHHVSFCQPLDLEGEKRAWNGRAFLGLNHGFGIITELACPAFEQSVGWPSELSETFLQFWFSMAKEKGKKRDFTCNSHKEIY